MMLALVGFLCGLALFSLALGVLAEWELHKRKEFRKIVTEAVEAGFRHRMAVDFEVAVSTVDRWARGTSQPHRLIRKQVVALYKGLLR